MNWINWLQLIGILVLCGAFTYGLVEFCREATGYYDDDGED